MTLSLTTTNLALSGSIIASLTFGCGASSVAAVDCSRYEKMLGLPSRFKESGNAMLKGGGEITEYADRHCDCWTISIKQRREDPKWAGLNYSCSPVETKGEVK